MDVSGDGWSDLRWCLFLGKGNVFAGAPLDVEAVLADFDALPDGAYEATFAVTDAAGRLHPSEPPRHLGPVGRDVSIAPPEGGPTDRTTRGVLQLPVAAAEGVTPKLRRPERPVAAARFCWVRLPAACRV